MTADEYLKSSESKNHIVFLTENQWGCVKEWMDDYAKYYHETELKKFRVGDVSGQSEQLVCTFCGINPIDEVCKHPKVCSEKKKVKAN